MLAEKAFQSALEEYKNRLLAPQPDEASLRQVVADFKFEGLRSDKFTAVTVDFPLPSQEEFLDTATSFLRAEQTNEVQDISQADLTYLQRKAESYFTNGAAHEYHFSHEVDGVTVNFNGVPHDDQEAFNVILPNDEKLPKSQLMRINGYLVMDRNDCSLESRLPHIALLTHEARAVATDSGQAFAPIISTSDDYSAMAVSEHGNIVFSSTFLKDNDFLKANHTKNLLCHEQSHLLNGDFERPQEERFIRDVMALNKIETPLFSFRYPEANAVLSAYCHFNDVEAVKNTLEAWDAYYEHIQPVVDEAYTHLSQSPLFSQSDALDIAADRLGEREHLSQLLADAPSLDIPPREKKHANKPVTKWRPTIMPMTDIKKLYDERGHETGSAKIGFNEPDFF